jgi:hypothetical protein
MQEIIEKARLLAEEESGKKVRRLFTLANEQGQILAKKLGANKDIVALGTLFMDIKLKQAMKEGRIQDHTQMSYNATKEFLSQFELNEEIKEKILNCVKEHHGVENFSSIESEICCNADCYKFLHPKGILKYINILMDRTEDFSEALNGAEAKLEEKHQILSLEICKEELEPYYKMIKELILKAKE